MTTTAEAAGPISAVMDKRAADYVTHEWWLTEAERFEAVDFQNERFRIHRIVRTELGVKLYGCKLTKAGKPRTDTTWQCHLLD